MTRLTEGQRALWFLHELAPESPRYVVARAMAIDGPLAIAALEDAFHVVAARHPALRTVFARVDSEPRPVVGEAPRQAFEQIDARGWSDAEVATEVRALAYRPFDLARGPLWRASILHRGDDAHVLVFAMHHIATDFWSLTVVFDEVRQVYEGGTDLPPPGDPARYLAQVDAYTASPAYADDLAWWRAHLDGAPPALDWAPTGLARLPDDAAPQLERTFDRALRDQLEALARRLGVTLHAPLLAAYDVLLARWTGQDDVVVGVPSAVRRGRDARRLVGYYVNTLPVRARMSPRTTFAELVAQASASTRRALVHQRLPFATLVERLCQTRSASRNPLFQAMFGYHRAFAPELEALGELAIGIGDSALRLGAATLRPFPLAPGAALFELHVSVAPVARGLACTFEYDPARLARATVEAMFDDYHALLRGFVDAPDRAVRDAPGASVPPAPWTALDYPRDARLHELVAAQARRTPAAAAVIAGARRLTYAELDARSDALAAQLQARGVGLESRVGLLVRRGADLIVAILGVLKAGAVYVPIDPAYPAARIETIARQSQLALLITEPGLPIAGVLLDELLAAPARAPRAVAATGDPLAYILYTSGSTGQPKGVCLSHRNAVAFVHWACATFSRDELAGVLASTSVCFDLSIFEIFAPLACGGCAIVVQDALALADAATAGEVTLINTVPSAMAALLAARCVPASVRTIALAGEALQASLVQRAYRETGARRVLNLYGPTEATTFSTFAELARDSEDAPAIGAPIANTRVYLLDRALAEVPAGMRGEVYIGGDGVARGYEREPAMTAARFVPDPFVPGARMYRTGDLAVRRPDGALHYLGRIDHQVKLRGFRIELGEVEARLLAHPAVRAAAVTVWHGAGAERDAQLVAHVVATEVSAEALRAHAAAVLPAYMVPSYVVLADALPYSPNGKLDRRRLPSPAPRAASVIAPRDALEAEIAGAWAALLGRDAVSIDDNFFALGGSSLLATRLAARLQQRLHRRVAVRSVFEHPTIAALAARLRAEPIASELDAIAAVPRVAFRSAKHKERAP